MNNADLILRVHEILGRVSFPGYSFTCRETHGGVHLRGQYNEPDIYQPLMKPLMQQTRKWLLSPQMTDSEIVQTIFKCVLTSFEHRVREHFKYRGTRIFGPHFDVEDLVRLCKDEARENAGGRK